MYICECIEFCVALSYLVKFPPFTTDCAPNVCTHTNTHTHAHVDSHSRMLVYVCVCVCVFAKILGGHVCVNIPH